MSVFYEIASNVKNVLQASELLSSINFVDSLQTAAMPNPLKKVYAAIEVAKVQIVNGIFSGYMGKNDGSELYGQLADVDVAIKIYSPFRLGAKACYDTFSNICEVLLSADCEGLNIQSVASEAINYNANTSNFVLECTVKISTFIGIRH